MHSALNVCDYNNLFNDPIYVQIHVGYNWAWCKCRYDFDFIECFTTTFLRAHSWLNWVDKCRYDINCFWLPQLTLQEQASSCLKDQSYGETWPILHLLTDTSRALVLFVPPLPESPFTKFSPRGKVYLWLFRALCLWRFPYCVKVWLHKSHEYRILWWTPAICNFKAQLWLNAFAQILQTTPWK